jgi:hypothetical protein
MGSLVPLDQRTLFQPNFGDLQMRLRVCLPLIAAALLVIAAYAPSASANVYCVTNAGCGDDPQQVFPMTEAGFNGALSLAENHPGDDEILLGVGTIEIDSPLSVSAGLDNRLRIEGSYGQSLLHFTHADGPGLSITTNAQYTATIFDMAVELDGASTGTRTAIAMNGEGLVYGINFGVESSNGLPAVGVELGNGARCWYCSFDLLGDDAIGVNASSDATVEESRFSDASPGLSGTTGLTTSGTSVVNVKASKFVGLENAISFDGGTLNLRDSIIDMGARQGATGVSVVNSNNSDYTLVADFDGVTVAGSGDEQHGVVVEAATTNPAGEQATASITNSLFMLTGGSANEISCTDDDGFGAGEINLSWSYKLSSSPSITGCTSNLSNNTDSNGVGPETIFVNWDEGDLRLRPGSPVIDLGDPATSLIPDRGWDACGNGRLTYDGGAWGRIDMGGCEYQNYSPEKPSITASRTTITAGESINFSVQSSDANGDPITYDWIFWDGGPFSTPGQNVTHAFTTPGDYWIVGRAYDGDYYGVSDELRITVLPAPGTGTPPPANPPAPTLTLGKPAGKFSLKLFASKPRISVSKPKKGGSVKLTMSAASDATVRLLRVKAGYVVGSACKAKQGKTGKTKRCDLAVGKARPFKVPAGVSYFAMGKKWGGFKLKPGKYALQFALPARNDTKKSILNVIR